MPNYTQVPIYHPDENVTRTSDARMIDRFNFPACSIWRTTNSTVKGNLATYSPSFDSILYQTPANSMFNLGNPSRLTAPKDGLYEACYSAIIASNQVSCWMETYLTFTDGVTAVVQATTGRVQHNVGAGFQGELAGHSASAMRPMKKGDYVELMTRSGAAVGAPTFYVVGGMGATTLALTYVRPYPS
jgi:hypothetical protein